MTYNTLNRINGFNYDNNGNVTWMTSGVTLTYDVDNRSTAMQGGFGTERYGYDPRNQRVYRKKADGTEEFTLWGANSERIETFRIVSGAAQTQTTNIYFAGRLMRTKDHTTGNETALVTNRVGSVAVRVNPSGINEKLRYYPYGEEYAATANDRDKFATYSRDSSTGLDYAMNRYYGSNLGRFLTPDPYGPSAKPGNPQSWNRYAYVTNDPINLNDPSGLDVFYTPGNWWDDLSWLDPIDLALWRLSELGGGGRGGGGGEGGGGLPPGIYAPIDVPTTLKYRNVLGDRLRDIEQSNCGKVFAKQFDVGKLREAAGRQNFIDGNVGSFYADLSEDMIVGNDVNEALKNRNFGVDAYVINDRNGNSTNNVVLKPNFFGSGADQANTVLHELLHTFLNAGDADSSTKQGLFSIFGGDGLQRTSGSADITRWLARDCQPEAR